MTGTRVVNNYKEKYDVGKVLGCFCKPKACHGDILAEVLNELKSKGEQL